MRFLASKYPKQKSGTQPIADYAVVYSPADVRATQQDKWSWPWPSAVQQGRFTNNWFGNQLPSETIRIEGVAASSYNYMYPRSLVNTSNWTVQYNRAFNIQGQSAVQSALLQQQIMQAWANRMS